MSPRAWFLFAAVSLVWGVPYFFIKVAGMLLILGGSWLSTGGRPPWVRRRAKAVSRVS